MQNSDSRRTILNDDQGSVIIETSLAIVLIMLVFLSGIYFLDAYRTKIVMEMAVKEGARQHQVSNNISNTNRELELGNVKGVTVSISTNRVWATKNIQINIPIVGNYLFNLKAGAEFRKENATLYYH